jgi:ergothioneine biosynthesis protein EgtB
MTTSTNVAPEREDLLRAYASVRSTTEALCAPLETEDMVVQTMPDVSPTKWHLGHVTWFFETLVLQRSGTEYTSFDERLPALFNSYYNSLGSQYPRARRGLLSRPTVSEVRAYRQHVDEAMTELLEEGPEEAIEQTASVVTVGLHHEQQHQELLLMDIKHVLAQNPLQPAYRSTERVPSTTLPMKWRSVAGGLVDVGAEAAAANEFTFDNERPRHTVWMAPFELASRPVTAGEYRAFMADGGYERPELWLSDGWTRAQDEGWRAPLYWEKDGHGWRMMTLGGLREIDPGEPVCHVSYYEAEAFARWAGCRLPTEGEWEHAADEHRGNRRAASGTFLESGAFHPRPLRRSQEEETFDQFLGDVWEWTSSPYASYPGYQSFEGDLGEYNGKFMVNQLVLRGGCCVTPEGHVRSTYRNFYYPHQRWMFAGFRLAR